MQSVIPLRRNVLVRYDEMCRAVAEARRVDEVKDIRDRALALQHYARQSKNEELERQCAEIRLRATRRMPQLYDAQEKAKGTRGDLAGRDVSGGPIHRPPENDASLSAITVSRNRKCHRHASSPPCRKQSSRRLWLYSKSLV